MKKVQPASLLQSESVTRILRQSSLSSEKAATANSIKKVALLGLSNPKAETIEEAVATKKLILRHSILNAQSLSNSCKTRLMAQTLTRFTLSQKSYTRTITKSPWSSWKILL